MINTDRLCMGCMNDNGGERICPICGYDSSEKNGSDCLPSRFIINDRFLVGRATSQNGEGITYIGWDNAEDSIVSIREYFPIGSAVRNPDKTVSIVQNNKYTFNEGLMEFLEINRTLKANPLPAVFPVVAVFEENGTVYAVSRTVTSITLREFLTRNGGLLKWEQAKPLFIPLVDTVKELNDLGIISRGISPETVLVGRDGKLRLTGISIVGIRRADSEITTQIFPGYAAAEQYGISGLHDGKYTDVYGLCTTLFRTLIGAVPPEATSRLENDSMTIPAKFADEIPRNVLTALANGLQVLPEDRTATVEDLRKELIYGEPVKAPEKKNASAKKAASSESKTSAEKSEVQVSKKTSSAKYVIISAAVTAAVFLAAAAILVFTVFRDDIFKQSTETDADSMTYSVPSVASIGSVDSGAAESVSLYSVPDFTGKYYSEIVENDEYSHFNFVIKAQEYSDKFERGAVCAQSVAAGNDVEKDTTVELTISLGSKEIKIANVVGLTEDKAKIELMKQGFLYNNIEVIQRYDADSEPGKVLEQDPKYGSSVNTEIKVAIYINSYTEPSDSSSD